MFINIIFYIFVSFLVWLDCGGVMPRAVCVCLLNGWLWYTVDVFLPCSYLYIFFIILYFIVIAFEE